MAHSAPLGRLLLDTGVLTQAMLDEALVVQRADRRRLGEILVERGLVHPHQLAQLLSHQMSCPWISLAHVEIAPEILALVSASVALEHRVVPVHLRLSKGKQSTLYVATDDPTDGDALADCAASAGMPVRAMVAVTGEIKAALARYYGGPPVSHPTAPPPPVEPPPAPGFPSPPATRINAKPPPPARKPSLRMALDERDVVEVTGGAAPEKRAPTVLALNAPEAFLVQCRAAVSGLGARVVDGGIGRASELVAEHRPCAIVVTDDVYAFDRSGLNRLALDNDAHLVVWSEDVDGRQLEPLLTGAIQRWGHSSYDKGVIVDGRYELVRDLGDDASQGVEVRWEVRNVRTARRSLLALAVRTDNVEDGEDHAGAIRREQKALARITHPGAVELRDAGTTELGDPYVVLEPLEGRTLEGLMAARTSLVPDDACAVVVQVAGVLGAAHAAGVVHHDVQATNIMVIRDGYGHERVKLRAWGRSTVGAPYSGGVQEDLVALGGCAVMALLGRRLEPDEDLAAAGVPMPVASVLRSLLAKELGSAEELARALVRALPKAGEPTRLFDASPRAPAAAQASAAEPSPGAEQRRRIRAPYRTPVRIEVPGQGAVDGRTEDISSGGLLVVARGELVGGQEVTVRFALPLDGRVVGELAVIRWSRDAQSAGVAAVGVELISPAAETVQQIERYVVLMGV